MTTVGAAGTAGSGALADRIAAAVRGCRGVAGLAAGPLATYLPGRTVGGVAVRDDSVQVAVTARYGWSLAETAAAVRAAVREIVPDRPVDVAIEDVAGAMGDGGRGPR